MTRSEHDLEEAAEERAMERRHPSEGTVGQERIQERRYERFLDGRWGE